MKTAKTITTVVDIDAPSDVVWAQLTDVGSYGRWNHFITAVDGDLTVGSRVKMRIEPPGGRPMTFGPRLTVADHPDRMEWLGSLLMPGVFDGRHAFRLEVIEGERTRLTQSEEFSGILVPIMGGKMLEQTRAGFDEMNQALRSRAEAAHRR